MKQNYILTIRDLFSVINDELCGAEAQVAILDNGVEIDRVVFSGKCHRYHRRYAGKQGLKAVIASGPGSIEMVCALLV